MCIYIYVYIMHIYIFPLITMDRLRICQSGAIWSALGPQTLLSTSGPAAVAHLGKNRGLEMVGTGLNHPKCGFHHDLPSGNG